MRLADTAPGSPDASDLSATSSMLSRVASPRRLVRRVGLSAPATPWDRNGLAEIFTEPTMKMSGIGLAFRISGRRGEDCRDGQAATVDETDGMVPGRVVGRSRCR